MFRKLRFEHLYRNTKTYLDKNPTLKWSLSALYWLPLGITFTQYGFTVKSVNGRSMQPTLNPDSSQYKDVVLFDRFTTKTLHSYKRGDVIALHSPIKPNMLLVKRIIALPGDTIKTLPPYPDTEVTVPQGHVWIEGDEPFHSEDSNWFGPVPKGLIDSKLAYIVFPLSRQGPLDGVFSRKEVRGQGWSRQVDELQRKKRRQARVKPAIQ